MRVVVVGAGIAGLAAAFRLRELATQHDVRLELDILERDSRIGGSLETERHDGFVLEMGPDSLAAQKPAGLALAQRLGLADAVVPVRPEYSGACVVRDGRLVRIPAGFRLFTPLSLSALVFSGLLSPMGIARAAVEPCVPRRNIDEDESLATFVRRRFGREVLDRLAQPLIGGIYSGDAERLSMRATMPQLAQMERDHGSVVRAMQRSVRVSDGEQPVALVSFRNGLQQLVDALDMQLNGSVRLKTTVTAVRRSGLTRAPWTVMLEDGAELQADAVVCGAPAFTAARLLHSASSTLPQRLSKVRYHSVATVTCVFATKDVPPLPRCTGFVVPAIERRPVLATTFSTQKYPFRAPEGYTVLRAFVGGPSNSHVVRETDHVLLAIVREQFQSLLSLGASPHFTRIRRYVDAMPEYSLEHMQLLDDIAREMRSLPGLYLVGSAYGGVGIADCIRSGEAAADAIFDRRE